MGIERKTFPSGDWWDYRDELAYGAELEANKVMLRYLKAPDRVTVQTLRNMLQGEGDDAAAGLDVDLESYDPQEIGDAMMLASTTAWSYGAVSRDVLYEVPASHVREVKARMRELYSDSPLALAYVNA